jgi:hypothetical protein
MNRNLLALILCLLAAGCATHQPAPRQNPAPRVASLFPPEALIAQRAVLTVHGRQFTLNGYLARSQTRGLRLVVTENFGGVLADVLVKPDGKTFVLQASPPFRPAWVENYLAADLKCLFGNMPETNCPVQVLSPTHFVITRRAYQLDLQTVEVKPGPQSAKLFDASQPEKP